MGLKVLCDLSGTSSRGAVASIVCWAMGMSPYLRQLRSVVGHNLLLLATVAVLVKDDHGGILLMKSSDTGQWQTIGGAIDPDETPGHAASREAKEEAGIDVHLGPVVAVLGGPKYRWTYPNGDRAAYVTTVFEATVASGSPMADGEEAVEVAWWERADLNGCDVNSVTRALLEDIGLVTPPTS
jgi:8-oxo-dGTP pyrophosphatase MutT (NUDIX family)